MKKREKVLAVVLLLALTLFAVRWSGGDSLDDITDLDSLRAKLKEKVSNGELTQAQAQLRLAEAMAAARMQARQRQRPELTAEQRAMVSELRAQVARGELTREEVRAKFAEAQRKAETAEPEERTR